MCRGAWVAAASRHQLSCLLILINATLYVMLQATKRFDIVVGVTFVFFNRTF